MVCLSARCLRDVGVARLNVKFTFIVDGERYACPRVVAELLSPRIVRYLRLDPSLSSCGLRTRAGSFPSYWRLGTGATWPSAARTGRSCWRLGKSPGTGDRSPRLGGCGAGRLGPRGGRASGHEGPTQS